MRRRKGRRRKGLPTFVAGAVGIVVIIVFSYLAYTKFANPFASPYTIHAVFSNANGLQTGSLVRIAGVNVGTVTGVSTEPGCKSASTTANACQASEVTMTIQDAGPADPQRRHVRDPAADLPGGQLLRRHQPRDPVGADRPRRPHLPDPAGRRAGPARSGADRPAGQHPPEPADPAAAVRQGGEDRRYRASTARSSTGCRPTSTPRSSPTTPSASSPTTSPTTSPPRATGAARWTPIPRTSRTWSPTSTPPPTPSPVRTSLLQNTVIALPAHADGRDSGLQRAQRRLPALRTVRQGR